MDPKAQTPVQTIEQTIGGAPIVQVRHVCTAPETTIYAKLEGNNPGGSVKDKPAWGMFKYAEEHGQLKMGDKIVEATSGNTGIALAMVAAIRGYEIELVMPENATVERVKTMRAYGADITLIPADQGMEGAIDYAQKKVDEEGYVMLGQFSNEGNPLSQYHSTGPEVWQATQGKITHFVSAMGTTGTIMGTSRYLKEQNPDIQIVGVHPADGESIPGIRCWSQEYMPTFYEPSRVDSIYNVTQAQAIEGTRRLAKKDGLLAGMSTGGAFHVASQLATELEHATIVFIACDRGDKYLSSQLFE